jgi:hypothetical protein
MGDARPPLASVETVRDELRRLGYLHPVCLVDSYGRRPVARAAGSDFDQDVIEQLKSLGYIQ